MYQYYNTELKDDTFAKLKKNIKITKERIPAATQLFTPDWIVRYMVENSVGRIWIEHLRSLDPAVDEKKKAVEFGWKYYLPEAEQEEAVQLKLAEIRKDFARLEPKDISCIDPCMGSGHILVYMFDVLMAIYKSEGFGERESVFSILENNIRGLDIDKRAYQLSYFALMMKAREYNRTFFRGVRDENGERRFVEPVVFDIEESNEINRGQLKCFGADLDAADRETAIEQVTGLLDTLTDAKEYGSILDVEEYDWELLKRFVSSADVDWQISLDTLGLEETQKKLGRLIAQGQVMAGKYWVVSTNPPYMGSKGIADNLLTYIQTNYPDGKADMYGVFIIRCHVYTRKNGIIGLLTPYVWLYISSFEKLRELVIWKMFIQSLIQLEYNSFEAACVPVCIFLLRNSECNYCGKYIQLASFKGWDNQEPQVVKAIRDFNQEYCYKSSQHNFDLIEGKPIAYWLNDSVYRIFEIGEPIEKYGYPRQGMATADNNRFMRLWFEVKNVDIDFSCKSKENTIKKWYPHSKGGSLRRWYGNNQFIVNWQNDGREIRNFQKAVVRNSDYYFRKGITWSDLTISWFTARYVPEGYTFDSSGPTYFPFDEKHILYICGYFNSWVFQEMLNISCQGMHYSNGVISKLPIIWGTEHQVLQIEKLVSKCIEISHNDWDERELSWDFKGNKLVREQKTISIKKLVEECMLIKNEQHRKLKEYEREIDSMFSAIFNIKGIKPIKGICEPTLYQNSEKGLIIDFISYAVGCMFGRYSLDHEGLVYAGGEWKNDNYVTFIPDRDGIIAISDSDYFNDDILTRFVDFVRIVYGEESLEENLGFIANVLGNKGDTSREVIRAYFLNDFYKDHCNTYSVTGSGKRPIYWLFDSGKQNGFKALIYMHRYTRETLNLVRSEYLRKTENAVGNALKNVEYIIQTTTSAVEKARATKNRDKYVKQLNEMHVYYQALSHMALQKIEIDLDDGVKHNYQLFQGVEVVVDGGKRQVVDLLVKI